MKKLITMVLAMSGIFSSGMVVILNGPSSVGKSSIQKALQKRSELPFIKIGIDTFFDALIEEPDLSRFEEQKKFDQYTPDGEYIRGIELLEDDEGNAVVPLHIGAAGERIMHGMHRAIAAYASANNNIIVDYILYKPELAEDLFSSLKNTKTYFIKINAPLEVIEEREKARATSPAGHARSHYTTVHDGMTYDLELSSEKATPDELADAILSHIKNHKPQVLSK